MTANQALMPRVINTGDGFRAIRKEWNELLSESSNTSVFLTWEWLHTWWEVYAQQNDLFIIALYTNGGALCGIAPFYIAPEPFLGVQMRCMRILGADVVCSEYLDIIAHKRYRQDVIQKYVEVLKDFRSRYDLVFFKDIVDNSLIRNIFKSLKNDTPVMYLENAKTNNRYISLPENEDIFYDSLDRSTNNWIKKTRNRLYRKHQITHLSEKEVSDPKEGFWIMAALHQKIWTSRGLPGAFSDEKFCAFHEMISKLFSEQGWLRYYFLSLNDEIVASQYGFQFQDTYYYYQGGFDPKWKDYSVGKMLFLHTINEAIRNGMKIYDLLRGEESYKQEYAKNVRHTNEIRIFKISFLSLFYYLLNYLPKSTISRAKNLLRN